MPRRDTDSVRTVLLGCFGLAGCAAGWFLPAPASYAGVLMGSIAIGGQLVLQAEVNNKIKEERRKLMRRELCERSRRGPDA
ncbi:hypothetical protein J7E91_19045 [Streptomyces sp. ISL-99]|uniref:hypothetical protein n=1 Tax=Streptomyces sp. ISL-99 TaxID=2819193 RepID=UPI001BE6EBDB|nr:hypothetical protein [Streptomyces sp. ISL-99]MBT2527464.1 hypothetical protein [Streptomyces sp. ISL-99]